MQPCLRKRFEEHNQITVKEEEEEWCIYSLSSFVFLTFSPPLAGLSSGVSGASPGEAEGSGGAESSHDHPGSRHGLHGQVGLNIQNSPQQQIPSLKQFLFYPNSNLSLTQEAIQEVAAVHCGHSEELPGFLLEEEVPAPPLGSAHLPEASARPAGPPGLRRAAGGKEEKGGGGVPQEDGGGGGEVS